VFLQIALYNHLLTVVSYRQTMSGLQPEFEKLGVSDHLVVPPPLTKRILTKAHLEAFQTSSTHQDIVEIVEDLNKSVIGVKLGQDGEKSLVSHASMPALSQRQD
jgi:hypothetical protein